MCYQTSVNVEIDHVTMKLAFNVPLFFLLLQTLRPPIIWQYWLPMIERFTIDP